MMTHYQGSKRFGHYGFTLVELSIAMALAVFTAFAVTSAVNTAVNAGVSYQARQSETNVGMVLAGMIKNDLKRATAVIIDPSSSAGDVYINMTVVDDDDLAAGNEGHVVAYHITGGIIYRGTGALGSAVTGLGYSNIIPELPNTFTPTVSCADPCGVAYDANGADVSVSGLSPVRFVITGLTVDIDALDSFSSLFDTDNSYELPELAFSYASGGMLVDDDAADAAAAAYVDPTDTAEAAAKEAADAVFLGGGGGGGMGGGGGADSG